MGRQWGEEDTATEREEEMTVLAQDLQHHLIIHQDGKKRHHFTVKVGGGLDISVFYKTARLERVSLQLQSDTAMTLLRWLEREIKAAHGLSVSHTGQSVNDNHGGPPARGTQST